MKKLFVRKLAQVIPLSEFRNTTNYHGVNEMKKKNLSAEGCHRLSRSGALSQFIFVDLKNREVSGLHQLYVPYLFSYISDDIRAIEQELKEKGLFGEAFPDSKEENDDRE